MQFIKRFLPAIGVLIISGLLIWFVLGTNTAHNTYAVKLGLDLAGGTELVYKADTSNVGKDVQSSLNSLRTIIDKRVNLFGVAEPLVQLEKSSAVAGAEENRLLVELPGVTDVKAAVDSIGKTPVLEFKLVAGQVEGGTIYQATRLTGQYVKNAELQFGGTGKVANEPTVVVHFNDEGAKMFEKLTGDNIGKQLAIFLDGNSISEPVIREAITGGSASISGSFTPQEARDLVQNLNFGALPVPISLLSSNTVGPTLGLDAYHAGLLAAMLGFGLVSLFMVLWYRLPGVIAVVALSIYTIITIAIIKFVPITLTASGIAGFILSIGMAVDANVLIFERMKEELRRGIAPVEAAKIGFARAWTAIRDGHLTMIISSVILFWLGTSLVQGFALVFGFGVVVSLLSAVSISRVFMLAILPKENKGLWKFFLSSGFHTH